MCTTPSVSARDGSRNERSPRPDRSERQSGDDRTRTAPELGKGRGTMPVIFTRFDDDGQPIEDERFTADEAADMLNVSVSTLRRRIRAGEWPATRPTKTLIYLSKADVNEIHELMHQDGVRRQLVDPIDEPPQLGVVVTDELDETAPIQ